MKLGVAADGGPPSQVLDLLEGSGLHTAALRSLSGPALLHDGDTTWLVAPGADVIEACVRGTLDAGVVGKDLLLELAPQVHELLDLRVCRDVLVYAAPEPDAGVLSRGRPRIATRYPRLTRRHFAATGRQVEIIAFGAAPLAPGLGIADGAVELRSRLVLDEGSAGAPGGLRVREEVAASSARLVVARAARALRGESLAELLERLRAAVEAL